MKNLLSILTILFLCFACSDDDTSTPTPSTDFIDDYLNDLVIRATNIDQGNYEFGVGFEVANPGQITHFNTTMPTSGDYRVTLWDASQKTILLTATVNQTSANTKASKSIANYSIEANKEYYITIQSNSWHEWAADLQSSTPVVPYTDGNFTVTRYGWKFTSEQAFPESFRTDYIAGAVSFSFLPNP